MCDVSLQHRPLGDPPYPAKDDSNYQRWAANEASENKCSSGRQACKRSDEPKPDFSWRVKRSPKANPFRQEQGDGNERQNAPTFEAWMGDGQQVAQRYAQEQDVGQHPAQPYCTTASLPRRRN
jgi:hypothetical protein